MPSGDQGFLRQQQLRIQSRANQQGGGADRRPEHAFLRPVAIPCMPVQAARGEERPLHPLERGEAGRPASEGE